MPIALTQSSTGTPYDLTGATTGGIALMARSSLNTVKGPFVALTGSVTSIASPATNGVFYYKFSTNDVANVGVYDVVVVVTYASDATRTFPVQLEIVNTE